MQDKLRRWLLKAEETTDRWTSQRWFKRFKITTGVIWNLAIILAIILLAGGVFAASAGAGYFASLVDEEKLRTEDEMLSDIYSYEETSQLYFADNTYLGKLQTDLDREETTLEDVADVAIDAVLATEDEYFFEHDGIVPKAIMRGLFQDVSNSDSQSGGSTLTQQLIKNQILTNEVSYERKAKEILLAMRLEKFMDKEDIMEAYLNIIPYGRNSAGMNIAGIETAAKGIFNVPASDLNLPQAAFIAGIPKAPFSYTPYAAGGVPKEDEALEPGLNRMKTVLYRMLETGYITEAEYQEALEYDIVADFRTGETRSYEDHPFVTTELEKRATRIIMDVLAEQNGVDPETLDQDQNLYEEYAILANRAVRSNGYRIHSSINKDLYIAQEEAQKAYQGYGTTLSEDYVDENGETKTRQLPVQVGSVTLENDTGRILSFVGGRDHEIEKLNHATQAYRSIGSTVKPLLVYGPALENGLIGAGSPVVDVKFTMNDNGDSYEPTNFIPTSEQGIMPARDALAQSQNLPALRLFAQMRDDMPIQYLIDNGFSRVEENDGVVSAALGGGIEGSVEEVANAYAALANGGKHMETTMIDKIEDADGNVIYEHEAEAKDVFTPQASYVLTDMLRDVFKTDRGTASRANGMLKFNADFAGKTGTTQDTKDVWLVGYNPNITMGVWLGYDQEKFTLDNFRNQNLQPSVRVNQLWANLMNTTYDVAPDAIGSGDTFKEPEGVVSRSFCGISGFAPNDACKKAGLVRSDLFIADIMTPKAGDDSLSSGSYTTINGKRYAALSNTPSEFISGGGLGVSEEYVDRMLAPFGGDAGKLFPGSSRFSNVVSSAKFDADSAAPAPVGTSINGRTITWSDSASNDVVGYRVFRNGSRVSSVSESSSNSYNASGPGTYTVVAVDITGRQSAASNSVMIEAPKPEPKPEPAPEPEPEREEAPAPSPETERPEPEEPEEPEEEPEEETPAPEEPEEPEEEEEEEPEEEPEQPEEPEEPDTEAPESDEDAA